MIIFRARKINGEVTIGACAGKGAFAARNGRGGKGKRKLKNITLRNRGIMIRFDTVSVILVNLRNRTGEERRRQTLCDKRTIILFETTFRKNSLSFKQIFL